MHFTATLARGFHPTTPTGPDLSRPVYRRELFGDGSGVRQRSAVIGSWGCWGACLLVAVLAMKPGASLGAWIQMLYLDKIIGVMSFLGGAHGVSFLRAVLFWDKRISRHLPSGVVRSFCFCFSALHRGSADSIRLQGATLAFFVGSTLAFLSASWRLAGDAGRQPGNIISSGVVADGTPGAGGGDALDRRAVSSDRSSAGVLVFPAAGWNPAVR